MNAARSAGWSVRALAAIAIAVGVGASAGQAYQTQGTQKPPAQNPPATQPPAQPQQEVDQLKFNVDTPILLLNQIKTEKAADFEAAWASIRAAFAKSDKPEVKAFGETLTKLYKVSGLPADAPSALYVFQVDAPSKTASYNPWRVIETLHKSGAITSEEADAILAKLKDSYQSINPWPLVKIGS